MGFSDWIARRAGYVKPDELKSQKRGFSAAQLSRLTASWATTPKPINEDVRAGLSKLRARARDAAINNDYVVRFLSIMRSNVVGPVGFTLQARAADPNGKLDNPANDAIETAFEKWAEFGTPEVTGAFSWVDCQNLFIDSVLKDGEALALIHRDRSINEFGFALEFIDPESLDVNYNVDRLSNGNRIVMGVEINAYRRPVAYHLRTVAGEGYQYAGATYTRVTADRVIHRFLPRHIMQTRGYPALAASLFRLNMLGGYEEAELVGARVASAKMGFFETTGDGEYLGEGTDAEGHIIGEAEPGTFEVLPPGVKFSGWSPDHPTTAFADFVKATLRGIAAGLNVSYFTLANDLEGVNYSSGRLGALEDREAYKAVQGWMIGAFIRPVYKLWLSSALLAGAIKVNGSPLKIERREKFETVTFQARRWSWVDPQKEIDSAVTAINERLRSRSDVIREQGRDPDDVWLEIQRENEKLKALGIEPKPQEPAQAGFFTPDENEAEQ